MYWFLALLLSQPADSSAAALDFDTQVAPIFTRYGCNSGACHGSAAGRGGFRLSLYGSNPSADYTAIVHELQHRRVSLVTPERSLILLKPTGQFDHEGDIRFVEDSPAAARLLTWIQQGANRTAGRTLSTLNVQAEPAIVHRPGDRLTLSATAAYSDGTKEDVTSWTVFTVDDPAALSVSGDGQTTVMRPGRHVVVARFLNEVQPVEIVLPWNAARPDITSGAAGHLIDQHIDRRLSLLGLKAAPLCSDDVFVRRVSLDLAGRLPSPEAVHAFVNDLRSDKRARLIDDLLNSPEFTDFWTLRLSKLLRINEIRQLQAATAFHQWVHHCVETGTGWDLVVNQLLQAEGPVADVSPAAFYLVGNDARAQAEYLTESLLGIRLRCANCHDHPLDQWTQDDYHGLSAVFAGIRRGDRIEFESRGTVIHPGTGLPATPRIPGARYLGTGTDHRPELSDWIIASDNPRLATAFVNRVWSWMMGRGLVEPVDDLRVTNPATHPELLRSLADDFATHDYSLRHLVRLIATSATWQRAAESEPGSPADSQFCSHALPRPLLPEVLLDAICTVTGVPEQDASGTTIPRFVAASGPQADSAALATLGGCEPGIPCGASAMTAGLSGLLALINGPVLNEKLRHPGGRVRSVVALEIMSSNEIIRLFYQLAFGRRPTAGEQLLWKTEFDQAKSVADRQSLTEDMVWSLLTSEEFRTNH